MGVPIAVWTAPELQSTVGRTVMVPKIVGAKEVAGPLHEQLLATAPSDAGREMRLIVPESLAAQANGIALVSYNEEDESDLALVAQARQANVDFVLRGEILPDRTPRSIRQAGDRLTVSWRLIPVNPDEEMSLTNPGSGGRPIRVDLKSALEKYPDLKMLVDSDSALQTALVRETFSLITPAVQRDRVQLGISYGLPGSRLIRKGNAFALAGRWQEAETQWQTAREKYPFSSVAVHNLAIAAVAKQDFASARELARKAVRMKPSKLHQETLVWVEQTQRAFHQAFNLDDPEDGWNVTR